MKRILIILFIIEFIIFINPFDYINCTSYAYESKSNSAIQNQNDIINTQKENLNISDFIKESQKYTKESMPGIDLNNLLSTAISGNIDNVKLMKLFFGLFRKRSFKFSCNFK